MLNPKFGHLAVFSNVGIYPKHHFLLSASANLAELAARRREASRSNHSCLASFLLVIASHVTHGLNPLDDRKLPHSSLGPRFSQK